MKKSLLFFGAFLAMAAALAAESGKPAGQARKTVRLNSGYEMPVAGLGTWTLTGETCENAVYSALKTGVRLIDTAKYYGNEAEVGRAIQRALAEKICIREEIFLTTKIVPWSSDPAADIEDSLEKLKVDYIDLCLLHQHGSGDDKVYRAMEKACKEGKIRSIGISNFYTPREVDHFVRDFEIKPAVIQNENHIFYQGTALRDWCEKYGIRMESYYPFGGRGHTKQSLENPLIQKIAAAHKKTSAQVIVRWHIQSSFIAIPGSSNPKHIAENYDIWDFELTADEMAQIAKLNTGKRYENW